MWGSSGHGTKQIAGVNFAIGVCARLNIRNMIPVLFLEKQKYRILGGFLHFVSYVLVVELFV